MKGNFQSRITALLVILAFLGACTGNSGDKGHEHHNDHSASALHLNHGKKWTVNQEMKPYVESSEQLLQDYGRNGGGDHQKLAAQLKENNASLLSSCTMTGEAHQMLHIWLEKHMALTKELENAGSAEQAEKVVDKLEESLIDYHTHFQ